MTEKRPPLLPPEEGACKGEPTQWWFPLRAKEAHGSDVLANKINTVKAKAICGKCPSVAPCLEYSLHHEPLGIWGGLDETERAILRRRRNIYADRSARVYLPSARGGRGGTRSSNPKPS